MKKQIRNRILFSLALCMCAMVNVSCEESFENTDAIIGRWHFETLVVGGDEMEINDDMYWEFKEDLSYSIENTQGKLETDPYDSNPFVGKGTYTGGYHIDAPAGLVIREKFKAQFHFSAVNIEGNEMTMEFTPNDWKVNGSELPPSNILSFTKID
jgi:hypothetical protein